MFEELKGEFITVRLSFLSRHTTNLPQIFFRLRIYIIHGHALIRFSTRLSKSHAVHHLRCTNSFYLLLTFCLLSNFPSICGRCQSRYRILTSYCFWNYLHKSYHQHTEYDLYRVCCFGRNRLNILSHLRNKLFLFLSDNRLTIPL